MYLASADSLHIDQYAFNFIAIFLFIGATGKSAQIPLYIWLPDAMAGPTPVSALIHAATMVTAGVYMVARCSIIFASAPAILTVIAIIGALTAFFAATIGFVQNDIKKVLSLFNCKPAWVYVSCARCWSIFCRNFSCDDTRIFQSTSYFLVPVQLFTRMHDDQDIQNFGGLRKYMPHTCNYFFGCFTCNFRNSSSLRIFQ